MFALNIFNKYSDIRRILPYRSFKDFEYVHNDYYFWISSYFSIYDIIMASREIIDGELQNNDDIMKIGIYSDECTFPHFHITNNKYETICCIRLDKPEFYNHEFIDNINNVSDDFIDSIIRTLHYNYEYSVNKDEINVYNSLVNHWNNMLYVSKRFTVNKTIDNIPDYNLLKKGNMT